MPRYATMPPAADIGDPVPAPALPHPLAYVTEPIKTGLLDQSGRDIYRMPDQIGFLPLPERK